MVMGVMMGCVVVTMTGGGRGSSIDGVVIVVVAEVSVATMATKVATEVTTPRGGKR